MAGNAAAVAKLNAEMFFDADLAHWYSKQPLMAPEVMILIRWREAYARKRVLDLGVGSGRTTRYIAPFASHYVGIDIADAMLAIARRQEPTGEFLNFDLRALGTMPHGGFDFIFGPFNALDVLDHGDRQEAIRNCRDLLSDKGTFVLSAHNRNHVDAGRMPRAPKGRGFVRNTLEARHYLVALVNYFRLKGLRREEADYALFNDRSHSWKGVFYYIDRQTQVRLFQEAGFEVLEVLGEDGRHLPEGANDSAHGFLHYVCRKV